MSYLADILALLKTDWPENRAVNIVCHGHSVPAGYFETPVVDAMNAYPHLLRAGLAARFPHAVINVIVTAIGGETSEGGAARFEQEVLTHRPDVLTIDYGLNDRSIGLEKALTAWKRMIEKALARDIKVILLTPTGDLTANLDDPNDPLNQHAEQIRSLARNYRVGLADSFAFIKAVVQAGCPLADLMSQVNHPNRRGHEIVVGELLKWFAE
jgi:lysophospholipase L1-like esterase